MAQMDKANLYKKKKKIPYLVYQRKQKWKPSSRSYKKAIRSKS